MAFASLTWKHFPCMAVLLKTSSLSSLGMASMNCRTCCFLISVPTRAVMAGGAGGAGQGIKGTLTFVAFLLFLDKVKLVLIR
jgi:hypothetical protein